MMNVLERLRSLLTRRDREESSPVLVPWHDGLELPDGTMLRYADIRKAAAFQTDEFVGGTTCLVLEFSDDRTLVVNETQPIWPQVVEALDANPNRLYSSNEWVVRIMANSREPIEIIA